MTVGRPSTRPGLLPPRENYKWDFTKGCHVGHRNAVVFKQEVRCVYGTFVGNRYAAVGGIITANETIIPDMFFIGRDHFPNNCQRQRLEQFQERRI